MDWPSTSAETCWSETNIWISNLHGCLGFPSLTLLFVRDIQEVEIHSFLMMTGLSFSNSCLSILVSVVQLLELERPRSSSLTVTRIQYLLRPHLSLQLYLFFYWRPRILVTVNCGPWEASWNRDRGSICWSTASCRLKIWPHDPLPLLTLWSTILPSHPLWQCFLWSTSEFFYFIISGRSYKTTVIWDGARPIYSLRDGRAGQKTKY